MFLQLPVNLQLFQNKMLKNIYLYTQGSSQDNETQPILFKFSRIYTQYVVSAMLSPFI